jgi:hypothetical protein
VRGTRLADSMSDYLIRVIDQTPNTRVRLHTEVIDSHGSARLEGLTAHDRRTGATELVPPPYPSSSAPPPPPAGSLANGNQLAHLPKRSGK